MEQITLTILILKGSVILLLVAGILNIVEERPVGILDTIVEGLWPSLLVLFFWSISWYIWGLNLFSRVGLVSGITCGSMICFLNESKPRVIFETDTKTLCLLRHLHDGNGQYLWLPAAINKCGAGTFLGHEIIIAKEKCLHIRYLFKDGTSNHTDFKLPKEVEDG